MLTTAAVAVALSPLAAANTAAAQPATAATLQSAGQRAVQAAPSIFEFGTPPDAGITPVADGGPAVPDVVGGTPAQSVSWVGDMQLDLGGDPNFPWCGVSLISWRWVVTNAHCVTNEPTSGAEKATAVREFGSWLAEHPALDTSGINFNDPKTWHLRIGSANRLSGGVVRHVTKIVVHPGWNWGELDSQGRVDDIALMELDKPIYNLQLAQIREASSRSSVRVVGWGYTTQPTDPDRSAPVQMQQLDVPLVDKANCANDFIANGEICLGLGVDGGGPCYGDSGTGALQHIGHSWALVGSASRLPFLSCGQPDQDFAVYTDESAFRDWMIRVVLGLPDRASVAGKHLPTLAEAKAAAEKAGTSKKSVALAG